MRFCSKCGYKLEDDQLYCPKCGNKEPLIKNDPQTSWKDFNVDKPAENVNYDFTLSKEPQGNNQVTKNKTLNILGKTLRITEIVIGLLYIVTGIVTIVIDDTTPTTMSLGIVCMVLAAINLAFITALLIIVLKKKQWNEAYKNSYLSSLILTLLMLGLSIGQYFLIKNDGFSPMGIMMGIMLIACNAVLAPVHSFKKTAK